MSLEGKKKEPVMIEGLDTSVMTNPQLQQHMMQIHEKLLKEREERSFFQLERDKMLTTVEISLKQLDEARAKIRNKDLALELVEERRLKDLAKLNQWLKFVEYEHTIKMNEAIIKENEALDCSVRNFDETQQELLMEKKELRSEVKAFDELYQQDNRDFRTSIGEEDTDTKKDIEKRMLSLVETFDKRLVSMKDLLETRHKLEMLEHSERENSQIRCLMDNHAEGTNDLSNYYNTITVSNCSVIKDFLANIKQLRQKEIDTDKQLKETQKENKALQDELALIKPQVKNLKLQLVIYEKETLKIDSIQNQIDNTKAALDKLTNDYKDLNSRFENEKLEIVKNEQGTTNLLADYKREMVNRLNAMDEKVKMMKSNMIRREEVINEFRNEILKARFYKDKSVYLSNFRITLRNYDMQRYVRSITRESLYGKKINP